MAEWFKDNPLLVVFAIAIVVTLVVAFVLIADVF